MFKKLFSSGPGEDQEEARISYEKVVAASRGAAPETARSARVRMGMLCRTHFDKTFVEGAEKTAAHRAAAARALIDGKEAPAAPLASAFQRVAAGGRQIWVYLPEEYAQQAFELGGRYQLTEIDAEQAIVEMQNVADQVFLLELRLEQPFEVLQFLREELNAASSPRNAGLAKPPHSG
jgi:hypothetical protein